MTYRDIYLERDLARMGTDDKALAHVLSAKRSLMTTSLAFKDFSADDPRAEVYHYYESKLRDVPAEVRCECCGVILVNVHRHDGKNLGSECVSHPLGSCRKRSP